MAAGINWWRFAQAVVFGVTCVVMVAQQRAPWAAAHGALAGMFLTLALVGKEK